MAERQRYLSFEPHTQAQRHDIEHASKIEPKDLQRHQRFIQTALVADQVDEAGDVAGAFGRGQSMPEGRAAQSNDRLHRLHILRADLHAHVAAGAVPDAIGLLERGESGLFRPGRFARVGDESRRLRERCRAEKTS